jgi:uncharacterized protein
MAGRYKILCVSDHIDPLVYSQSIKERFADIDFVLGAGDLDLGYYGFIVSTLNVPLAFVFGNHNLTRISYYRREYQSSLVYREGGDEFIRKSYGSTYVGDKARSFHGILLAGLGGSKRYNWGPNQFSEFQMYVKILRLFPRLLFNRIFSGRWIDVLLTHAPPRKIHDREDICHQGFHAFRWFMRRFKPQFLVHGHVHLYDLNEQRRTQFYSTTVVNAYEHTIIEIAVT